MMVDGRVSRLPSFRNRGPGLSCSRIAGYLPHLFLSSEQGL